MSKLNIIDQKACVADARVLMIDNYDSFTYNLVQYLAELGCEVMVRRNDECDLAALIALEASHVVISPGPRTPNDAGVSLAAIEYYAGKIPVLGVCLGHQAIGQVYGGEVVRAGRIMHGKVSPVTHQGKGVFTDLPSPLICTRYHSLVVDQHSLPDCLEVTAWCANADGSIEEVMGFRHTELAVEGVQYHPESLVSEHGHAQLRNFLLQRVDDNGRRIEP